MLPSKSVVLLLFVLVSSFVLADDGRIPIWQPTTITTPGAYILARDIHAPSPSYGIDIATSHVDLDLNGFQVSADDFPVRINPDVGHVTIRNGRITADLGLLFSGTHEAIILEDLDITGFQFALVGVGTCDRCRIANNTIRATGNSTWVIDLGAGQDTEYVNNRISGIQGYGLRLRAGARGFRIVGNTVHTIGNACIQIEGTNHLIADNVLGPCGNHGIYLMNGGGNHLRRNTVNGCVDGALTSLDSDFNHIEGNLLTGSGWGLLLLSDADNNVVRGNTALNNAIDFEDNGTNNQSHGDNYRTTGPPF